MNGDALKGDALKGEDTERQVRALANAAALPQQFDTWPGVLARLPQVRRRRTAARAATAAAAVLAVAVAVAVAVPLAVGTPPSAVAAARRAAAVASTGAGLPPFTLTEVTTTVPTGFQPEPPPRRVTQRIDYAGPARWREGSAITEPFGEGTQTITQIRNGPLIATVAAGRVSITRAAGQGQLPLASPWQRRLLPKLAAAASTRRCAPKVSLAGNGPLIDGRPTAVLRAGPSPCPSADVPQADGPATFWLDKQTFLVLRAVLHGPGNRVAQTITVTHLRYHARFPAGTFHLPAPRGTPPPCSTVTPLPSVAALRRALAYPPLIPSRLLQRWHTSAIDPGATDSHCKITAFTITYEDAADRPAVQLYQAPQASPSVRFPGRAVTIRPGLTGTLNSSNALAILWWIQDGRYCSLQTGGLTAGVRLTRVPDAVLVHIAASLRQ